MWRSGSSARRRVRATGAGAGWSRSGRVGDPNARALATPSGPSDPLTIRALVRFLFLDDSSQRGARDGMGSLVSVGSVMLDEAALRPLSTAVDECCRAAGVPDGTELKWSPPRDNWLYDNLHGDDRANLFAFCLQALGNAGGRAVAIVWDTGRTTLQGDEAFSGQSIGRWSASSCSCHQRHSAR